MKKMSIGFYSLLLSVQVFANQNIQIITSEIKEVTVFQQGAQINRKGAVMLNDGVTEIVFTDLPQNIDQRSIQVSGTGNFSILSVNYQINYLKTQIEAKDVKILTDSLKLLEFKKNEIENNIEICQQEEVVLMANKVIGGTQNGVNVETLKTAMNYFLSKLNEIKTKELKQNVELRIIDEKITRLQNQLNSVRSIKKDPISEIIVKVNAASKTNAKINLRYVIYNAGWYPEYDIRAININEPVNLIYKAKVFQSSGEEWNNVKLTISTGNPQISGEKPIIYPWYVNFKEYFEYKVYDEVITAKGIKREEPATAKNEIVDYDLEEEVAEFNSFTQSTNQTNVEFNIDIPYSIPSTGKEYTVQINEYKLDASFTYYAAPKLNTDAFLLAKITGWAEYNLLAGQANIFFEGTFVGNSTIDPSITRDTLDLSLGRDQSIVITRTKIKDFESKKVLGINKKETYGWEISVRNNKNSAISLILEDQFPISSNKDIEVEQIEKSNAKLNETTGRLTWDLKLNSLEAKNIQVKYSIKYPKDKILNM
ncbi:MAG: hypothetical protein A2041_01275 [Bacteroidetes bacterium GWA2_31_9b]|nr:MAG: hypothetical protein A2041_01275 [Bacteroidetes bacterium GWA2_31_9b]